MADLLASKIIVQEEEPSIRTFPDLASAVLGVQGVAKMGPVATPTLVTSYSEFESTFGGFIADRQLALAVRAFFLSGGQEAYVNRIVHYTDISNASTKQSAKGYVTLQTSGSADTAAEHTGTATETFDLEPNDTLVGNVEGVGNQTATFTAAAGTEECASAENYNINDGDTLLIKVNGGDAQTITLAGLTGGAATAEEVAQSINDQIAGARAKVTSAGTKVTLESDRRGSSSSVQVTGGTANSELGFDGAVHDGSAGSNVSNIDAVTVAEVETVVEAAWTNGSGVTVTSVNGKVKIATVAVGGAVTLEIVGTGTATTVLGLTAGTYTGSSAAPADTLKIEGKWDGAYANSLKVKIANATNGATAQFDLQILEGTDVLESFNNLTMDTTATRYVETIINDTDAGSIYVTAADQSAVGSVEARRPANTSGSSMTSGDDGLTSLAATDFVGDQTAQTGLYAFDNTADITLLACPDETSQTTQAAMITYCETDRQGLVFAILDPVAGRTATTMIAQKDALNVTEHAAIYWPRLKIINPSASVFGSGTTVTICPSGCIAGLMASFDRNAPEGAFYQPAGTDARPYGVVDLETEEVKLESKRDLVYPERINPITYLKGYGIFIDGSRTLKGTGNFPSIGERRGVIHIERQLHAGLQWVRHRNNTPALRRQVHKDIYGLLSTWMNRGAFASTDPATAFFVDVSDALNPPSSIRAGKLVARVGMATNAPAEFIIIKITKDTRALEEELYG